MRFSRIIIPDIPVMCVVEPGDPGQAASRAFDHLESSLPSLRGRRFYGLFDPKAAEYRACVALRAGDSPEAVGAIRGVIPGGTYLRARLRGDDNETTALIGQTFEAMAAAATPDQSRQPAEFYRRHDELELLFPIMA